MLKKIKKQVIPLREYTNFLHFPYEILDKTDKKIYKQLCQEHDVLKYTCCYLSKSDLLDENYTNMHFLKIKEFYSVEAYLCFLEREVNIAVSEFEKIIEHSNIIIPPERFEKDDIFTSVF